MSELDGRTALISGAGRGIGAATALRLAKEGARVIVSDILEDVGQRTTREIKATGAKAVFVRLDVTKEVDWNAACETAKAQFGELDILVNNAGVVLPRSMEETTLDEWRRQQSVNVEGGVSRHTHLHAIAESRGQPLAWRRGHCQRFVSCRTDGLAPRARLQCDERCGEPVYQVNGPRVWPEALSDSRQLGASRRHRY
jgi:NAD(P)-dependent dehydrogenase (short-subunit alcohol dehydrogenase family)